jgi:DNA replication protein DnaC
VTDSPTDFNAFLVGVAAKHGVQVPEPREYPARPAPPAEDLTAIRRLETQLASFGTVPESYRDARFDSDRLVKAVDKRLRDKAAAMLEQPFVTFSGPSGTGKTPLAVALFATKIARASWPTGLFRSAATVVRDCDPTGGRGEDFWRAMRARLLLLDDVGQEPNAEWSNGIIRELIEERDARKGRLHTIVTTNLSTETVVQRYGEGCAKRLFRDAEIRVGKRG